MTRIKVRISPDGSESRISVEGVAGAGCEKLTESLEAALGEVKSKKHTDEFHLQEVGTIDCCE